MDEFEPICGPGGMGCLYCTKHCPNCHREIFVQDAIYGNSGEYCRYCRVEVAQRLIFEDDLDDDIIGSADISDVDEEILNEFRDKSSAKLTKQINDIYIDIINKLKK